jgi:hypothetical protein
MVVSTSGLGGKHDWKSFVDVTKRTTEFRGNGETSGVGLTHWIAIANPECDHSSVASLIDRLLQD